MSVFIGIIVFFAALYVFSFIGSVVAPKTSNFSQMIFLLVIMGSISAGVAAARTYKKRKAKPRHD